MPYNQARKAYTRKPPSGVKPNLGHPLLKDAYLYFPLTEINLGGLSGTGMRFIDRIKNIQYSGEGGGSIYHQWSPFGAKANVGTLAGGIIDLGLNVGAADWAGYTFVAKLRLHTIDGASYQENIFSGWQASGTRTALVRYQQSGNLLRYYQETSGGNANVSDTSGILEDGNWHTICTFFDTSSSIMGLAIDGHVVSTTTRTGTIDDMSSKKTYLSDSPHSNDPGRFEYQYFTVLKRGIAEGEIKDWHVKPWAPFSRPLPIWIPSGAAPPAWNNTINEIAAPGAVNEITNANIQSVNEI